MKTFTSDNQNITIEFHDHRADKPYIYGRLPGDELFEGFLLDDLTFTAEEMLDLGNYLILAGRAKQNDEYREEKRAAAMRANIEIHNDC